jgi:hypothetical protein
MDPKHAGDLQMRGRSPDPPQRQSTVRQNNHAATLNDTTLSQVFHRGRELTTVLASEKSLEMLANRDSPS